MKKIIDRLYDSVEKKGHVCLGLDTAIAHLPQDFYKKFADDGEALFGFNKEIIDHTIDVVAVYKVQIAYYEALGLSGMAGYSKTLKYLRSKGAIVIADVKRGDIANTAEMYAKGHFTGDFEADFITLNPFMGADTLSPFFPYLETGEKGLFALVATSNPGAADVEGLVTAKGNSVSDEVGAMINGLGKQFVGDCGYSAIGAVVGCTNKEQTTRIREKLSDSFFLIPGYGAQGGTAKDMADYLKEGNGGVVNSSRAILTAGKKPEFAHLDFAAAARAETIRMRDEILDCLK